jgi:hypothetical protein
MQFLFHHQAFILNPPRFYCSLLLLPPPPQQVLCVSHTEIQKSGVVHAFAYGFGHEGFVQATLLYDKELRQKILSLLKIKKRGGVHYKLSYLSLKFA